eukprot:TRINITY_DN14887_c1_g6_i1.p1 TRINITY_DN14887_c1_g6~~TRINITY_DN14887_c1_g6_i1.p1  ORF type:complete len:505 (+),score=116.42 TRINITY_DN14887_c1_g6_i1:64-1578(+)
MVGSGVEWWTRIGSPRWVLAPMVEQSEPAFRLLCRSLGTGLAFTPMMHASLLVSSEEYRRNALGSLLACSCDRPLSAQICAADPEHAAEAAEVLAGSGMVDAVDINMGCPQHNARKGGYGAFLQEGVDEAVVAAATRAAAAHSVPVTVKLRCHEDGPLATAARCRRLLTAGSIGVTLHGRRTSGRGERGDQADWTHIREVFAELEETGAWLCANGGVLRKEDAGRLLAASRAHSVMSADGLLWDPGLFSDAGPQLLTSRIWRLDSPEQRRRARELTVAYLRFASVAPASPFQIKEHVRDLLAPVFDQFPLLCAQACAAADVAAKPRCEKEFDPPAPSEKRRHLCLWARVVRAAEAAELMDDRTTDAAPLGRVIACPEALALAGCCDGGCGGLCTPQPGAACHRPLPALASSPDGFAELVPEECLPEADTPLVRQLRQHNDDAARHAGRLQHLQDSSELIPDSCGPYLPHRPRPPDAQPYWRAVRRRWKGEEGEQEQAWMDSMFD